MLSGPGLLLLLCPAIYLRHPPAACKRPFIQLSGQQPEMPVISQSRRLVDPGLAPQTQIILYGDHSQACLACQGQTDEIPVDILCRGTLPSQVFTDKAPVLSCEAFKPSHYRVIVMGSRIYNAVFLVLVGQIGAVFRIIKGEFQHLHAWKTAVF